MKSGQNGVAWDDRRNIHTFRTSNKICKRQRSAKFLFHRTCRNATFILPVLFPFVQSPAVRLYAVICHDSRDTSPLCQRDSPNTAAYASPVSVPPGYPAWSTIPGLALLHHCNTEASAATLDLEQKIKLTLKLQKQTDLKHRSIDALYCNNPQVFVLPDLLTGTLHTWYKEWNIRENCAMTCYKCQICQYSSFTQAVLVNHHVPEGCPRSKGQGHKVINTDVTLPKHLGKCNSPCFITLFGTDRIDSWKNWCWRRASTGLMGESGAWVRTWWLISDSDVSRCEAAARASRRNFSRSCRAYGKCFHITSTVLY